jgi:hypothetical protein
LYLYAHDGAGFELMVSPHIGDSALISDGKSYSAVPEFFSSSTINGEGFHRDPAFAVCIDQATCHS